MEARWRVQALAPLDTRCSGRASPGLRIFGGQAGGGGRHQAQIPILSPPNLVALEHGTHSNTGFLCSSNVFPRTLEHMFLLPSCRLEHAEHTFEHTNTPRTPNTSNTVQSQTPRTHSELSTRTRDQDIHISTSTAVLPKQLTFSNTVPNTTEHQPEHIF